ncbi:MAG: recombination mediator RecR [Desulfobacteraceae bacterium]|nr:recombination mediator RecR [Desulfobacteraceae bacterium]MCF8096122.1 recombination mediator RecR [Desulfobacteraceae bacterium]
MNHYPEAIVKLIRHLRKLPGIGEKTAERFAMYLLAAPGQEVSALAASIAELKEKVKICNTCFCLSDSETCRICSDPSRNHSLVCAVETPADMAAIEKSGAYTGVYHVLQGLLSPMDGIGPDEIRIRELVNRVAAGKVKEIIIATSTSVEGEATSDYITRSLKSYPVKITRIASGVPMGGELKYIDQVTLKKAMEARRAV